jgi:hypothetical protein
MTATQIAETHEILARFRAERAAEKRAALEEKNAINAARMAFWSRWDSGVPADIHPKVREILARRNVIVLNEREAVHGNDADREQCAQDGVDMIEAARVAAAEEEAGAATAFEALDGFVESYELAYLH